MGVIYAVHYATGKDLSVLSGANPGEVSRDLTAAWKGDPALEPLAERYKAFVNGAQPSCSFASGDRWSGRRFVSAALPARCEGQEPATDGDVDYTGVAG